MHADAETQLKPISNMVVDLDKVSSQCHYSHIAAATIHDPSILNFLASASFHCLYLSGGPIVVSRSLPLFATDLQLGPVVCCKRFVAGNWCVPISVDHDVQVQVPAEKMVVVVLADLGPCSVYAEHSLQVSAASEEDTQEIWVNEGHEKVCRC